MELLERVSYLDYRKELFISIIPLDTTKSCLMNQQELADLISKLEQKQKEENK